MEEFKKIYTQQILPSLRAVDGCRYAALSENAQEKSEALSLTIWDTRQNAINYEGSELSINHVEKVKHTFSDLFQWKILLEEENSEKVTTSEDPRSNHYTIVTGKSFNA